MTNSAESEIPPEGPSNGSSVENTAPSNLHSNTTTGTTTGTTTATTTDPNANSNSINGHQQNQNNSRDTTVTSSTSTATTAANVAIKSWTSNSNSNGGGHGNGNGSVLDLVHSTSTTSTTSNGSSTSTSSTTSNSSCTANGTSSSSGSSTSSPAPFAGVPGEKTDYYTQTSGDGQLIITNYRLFVAGRESPTAAAGAGQGGTACLNLPLGLVESLEVRDIFYLHVQCKDARSSRITFSSNETAIDVSKRLTLALAHTPIHVNFAFTFHARILEDNYESANYVKLQLGLDLPKFPNQKERFLGEIKRMEFNIDGPWRVSDENEGYELCGSYPTHIIVPSGMTKSKLKQSATFRSAERFPAVVWRHRGNGAVIARCSQPEVGWFGWRSTEDEELVQYIVLACAENARSLSTTTVSSESISNYSGGKENSNLNSNSNSNGSNSLSSLLLPSMEVLNESPYVKKLLILDARSYTTAVANRARGGGCECLEYYPHCEIQFMNLANIHSIRKSFTNLRQLASNPPDQANWYSQLEGCKWLQHMSGLMKAALQVVTAIENDGRPVMVHCSDGWDRTPQIVALAEILLDPYYRSLEGFQVLVEREWFDFGHKFGDRCGQGVGVEDSNEKCPVFLQWLDCIQQIIKQFPTAFEFNQSFLVKLAQHTYSNLFGTFLCNTAKEREEYGIDDKTISVWRYLRAPANYQKFRNQLYFNCDKVLWPNCEVRDLSVWSAVYLGNEKPDRTHLPNTSSTASSSLLLLSEVINPSTTESSPAPSVSADSEELLQNEPLLRGPQMRKTLSCEDLTLAYPTHTIHTTHNTTTSGTSCMTRRLSDPEMNCSYSSDAQQVVLMGCSCDLTDSTLEPNFNYQNQNHQQNQNIINNIDNTIIIDENTKTNFEPKQQKTKLKLNSNPSNTNSTSCTSTNECCNTTTTTSTDKIRDNNPTTGYESESENESEDIRSTDISSTDKCSTIFSSNFRRVENLKSIESSTDTLVAELGILAEPTNTNNIRSTRHLVDDSDKTDSDSTDFEKNQLQLKELHQCSTIKSNFSSTSVSSSGHPVVLLDHQMIRPDAVSTNSNTNSNYPLENLCFTTEDLKQNQNNQDFSSNSHVVLNGTCCEVCKTSRKILNGLSTVSSTVLVHNNSDTNYNYSNGNCSGTNTTTTNNTTGSRMHSRTSSIGLPTTTSTSTSTSNVLNLHVNLNGVSDLDISNQNDGHLNNNNNNNNNKCDKYNNLLLLGDQQNQNQNNNVNLSNGLSNGQIVKAPYDVDGLTPLHDEVQLRLNSIISIFQGQVESLQRELYVTRLALMKQVSHRCAHNYNNNNNNNTNTTTLLEDMVCPRRDGDSVVDLNSVDSVGGGGSSVGSSGELGGGSWEAVDESQTRPPLWVPDYAVSRCMRCSANFWMGKRKHHCRSCGKIFCAECSENKIPIPGEQIFSPVRVCLACYNRRGAAELLSQANIHGDSENSHDLLLDIHSLHSANNTESESEDQEQQQLNNTLLNTPLSYASVVGQNQQQQQQNLQQNNQEKETTNLSTVKGECLVNGHQNQSQN